MLGRSDKVRPGGYALSIALIVLISVPLLPFDPSRLDAWTPALPDPGPRTDVNGVGYYLPPTTIPETPPEYVIVCPREFVNASLSLADHRTRLGLSSRTYAIEDIVAVYEGYDPEEEVHMFLRNLSSEYPTFQWLLILGDSEFLGPRQLWHYAEDRGQPFGNYYYSDVYYAGLGSDWDENDNHLYGELSVNGSLEADLEWDIFVGRAPASTEKQAMDFVQKLIRYEKNPPVGTWMKRFLNWGSLMEPPNLATGTYKYQSYKGNAYKVCSKVEANLPEHLIVRSLYDYPQLEGGQYDPFDGRDTLNRNNMLMDLNTGASMLNFAGQARYEAYALNDYGPPTGFGEEYLWNEPLHYSDPSSLTNGDMVPFMYASSCDVAKFFQTGYWEDKSLETFITEPSGGLIGLISSTGTSARGEEQNRSWGNWYLDELFWNLFLNKSETRPGRTLFKLKQTYQDEWFSPTILIKETILGMIYSYILLGDPYTDIYTDIAGRFMLQSDLRASFYKGEHTVRFQVRDRDLEVVPYPSVTFYSPEAFLTVEGDGNGWVNATLDLKDGSSLNITLSKHNMVPAYFKVDVLPEIADVSIAVSDIGMDPPVFSPGENVSVSVTVRNLGGQTAQDVILTAEMESFEGDPKASLATAQLGTIPGKGSSSHQWTWRGRPGLMRFRFRASTTSAQIDPYNDVADLFTDVPGPHLKFEQGSGVVTPSLKARPGSASRVAFSVLNEGKAASDLFIGLFSGDPEENGTMLLPLVHAGNLFPGQWANGSVQFVYPESSTMLYLDLDPLDLYPPTMADGPIKQLLEVDNPPTLIMAQGIQLLEDPGSITVPILEVLEDPDTPISSLSVRLRSADNLTATLQPGQDGGSVQFQPFKDWYGATSIDLEVDDGSGAFVIGLPVTVVPVNDPPVFLDGVEGLMDLMLLEDVPFTFVIRAFDVEGDTIIFSSPGSPFSLDAANGTFMWSPGHLDAGTEEHSVFLDDGHGGLSELVLRILVVEMNDPPAVGGISDIELKVGDSRSIDLSIEDEEGGPFIISSTSPLVAQKGPKSIFVNGSEDHVGVNRVVVMVSDGVNSVHIVFNVTVVPTDGGDGNESEPLDVQLVLAAVGIALIAFSVLLVAFLFLRRSRSDAVVTEEKEEADRLFAEGTTTDEALGPSGGGGAEE